MFKPLTILFLVGIASAAAAELPALDPVILPPPPALEVLTTQHVIVRGQEISFSLVKFPNGMVCQSYIQSITLRSADPANPLLDVYLDDICDEPVAIQGPYGELHIYPRMLRGLRWVEGADGLGRHSPIMDTRAR